jgi:hypothetical protein
MVIVAKIQFMEWLLLAVALLVVEHLLYLLVELLAVAVVVEVLIPILQDKEVQAELVIQAHLLVVLEVLDMVQVDLLVYIMDRLMLLLQ